MMTTLVKPILIAIMPLLTIFFLQWRVEKWRKMHLTLFTMFFWLTAIIPTAYPVAIALVVPFELQGDALVSLPYSTSYRAIDLVHDPVPFKGSDYASFCGDTLYAPQNGWVSSVGTNGFCGEYGCGNTFIEFENEVGTETVMLHGDYILQLGDTVRRGQTIIGYEASNGNSSGCHTDFWTNGLMVEMQYIETLPEISENQIVWDKQSQDTSGLPIVTTWYDPELGGINCEEPCDIYAGGERVLESHYYGHSDQTAACLAEWLGRSIHIQGLGTFICRDVGSSIVIKYNEYFDRDVIHVDILAHPGEMVCDYCLWDEWRLK